MDDYLAKPIDEKMLTRVLSRYHSGDVENAIADDAPLSLDWPLALRQAANKPDLARDLLQMLLDFLPQVRERVQALLDGQHDDEILDLVHKLHGSCTAACRASSSCVSTSSGSCVRASPTTNWSRSGWSCWMRLNW